MSNSEIRAREATIEQGESGFRNVTGTQVGNKFVLDAGVIGGGGTTGPDGEPIAWDTITYDYTGTASDVYTYSLDATDVLVITQNYTDSSKGTESTLVKTIP